VRFVRHPDRGEFAGTQQARQRHRITPVGLHVIARSRGIIEGAMTMQLCPSAR
jgi:hypothetical protein